MGATMLYSWSEIGTFVLVIVGLAVSIWFTTRSKKDK